MIVVTGANGFVGRKLVKELIANGEEIRAIDLAYTDDYPTSTRLHTVVGDIRDFDAMSRAINTGDTVIHLAARVASPSVEENRSINVEGTSNICDVCQRAGSRLLFMSAAAAKFASANAYGTSKRQAEEVVSRMEGEKLIMRTPLIVGRGGEEYERFAEYVRKFPGVVPVFGPGTAAKQPIHIDDVTLAIIRIIGLPDWNFQILEIACCEQVTFDELIDLECAAAGIRKWKIHIPLGISMALASIAEAILGNKSPITRDIIAGLNEPVEFNVAPALALLQLSPSPPDEAFRKAASGL